MVTRNRFAALNATRRTWAIAAVHGESDRLQQIHAQISDHFTPGDTLVYLGNYFGRGPDVAGVIQELLLFRRVVIGLPGGEVEDVVFLRGAQEEMWQKLLTIQFAPNPKEVLHWMLNMGVGATLQAYGSNPQEGQVAARDGVRSLTQWTNRLRAEMRQRDGHNALMSAMQRAAYRDDNSVLFVSAGIDPSRPLSEQTDSFWWGDREFTKLDAAYGDYQTVVRGFDPQQRGPLETPFTATLDAGCGFGGPLRAVCYGTNGKPELILEA
ncbi:MAG: hypothetical protein ACPGO3_06380 [Magnetospiraceae bacterium]